MREMDRQEVIQELIDDQISTVQMMLDNDNTDYIDSIFRNGFTGYHELCNEDLEACYLDLFDMSIKIVDEIF